VSGLDLSNISILVVDDDPFTCTMLSGALTSLGAKSVRTAKSVAEGLWVAAHAAPQAAVIDLDLGEGPTGIDLAHGLRKGNAQIGIVMLSTYEEPRLMGLNQPALPEGSIYMVKRRVSEAEELCRAVTISVKMAKGEDIEGGMLPSQVARKELSDQQIEIMRLIAAGHSNSEISRIRHLSISGVENAVTRLCKHLTLASSSEKNQRVLIAQAYFQMTGAVSVRRR